MMEIYNQNMRVLVKPEKGKAKQGPNFQVHFLPAVFLQPLGNSMRVF